MKVLLLTQWFPPEPRKIFHELAETLGDMGHDVTVLTGFPNWPSGHLYPGYRMRLFQREVVNGISVIRVPLFPDHSQSRFRRSLSLLSFSLAATVLGPLLTRRPNLIHAIQPIPAGLAAVFLGWLWGVPFTLEIQDLWPESLEATGFAHQGLLMSAIERVIGWIHKRSSKIRVISGGFQKRLIERGVNPNKIEVISNWVETGYYRPTIAGDFKLSNIVGAGKFCVVFGGLIGAAQDLGVVVQAAGLLRDLANLRFIIVGDGIERISLEQEATHLRLENVSFVGWKPEADMPGILSQADALLLHLRDEPLFHITVPHKTYAYLSMGKPILAAMAGDSAEVIRAAGAGIICRPGSATELAAAVRLLVALPAEERARLGRNGRAAACREYDRQPVIESIDRLFRAVLKSSQSVAS